MQQYKSLLVYGFAIFSMFFGSGNLVFPIQIGMTTGNHWFLGFLGLFITGIILPFLGLFVIKLYRGNYSALFAEAGSVARVALPFFILSLLGSFGVVPRCIVVAYGGIAQSYPELSLPVFSLIFSGICYVVCLNDQIMIKVLGKWMTPLLLLAILMLITIGTLAPLSSPLTAELGQYHSLNHGFFIGYQTMDLFAAFFFSALIFQQIQQQLPPNTSIPEIIKTALKPSALGAALLATVYAGFVFLGAKYQPILTNVAPELLLPTIARQVLGQHASIIIGAVVMLSCLTTAVALNNIYARYLNKTLRLANRRFPWMLLFTTGVSFALSLLDFRGIAGFLAPILEVTYPSLIALTLLGIATRKYQNLKMIIFYVLLVWQLYGSCGS